jgi:beta-ribofuranosylaminobenzene 5'-phosphate synthase
MLSGPTVEVTASLSRGAATDFNRLDAKGRRDVQLSLERLMITSRVPNLKVVLERLPPQHIGLGTKTATVLAALRACVEFAPERFTRERLQVLSGRGGTSGIGVNGFFTGGFVADAGQRDDQSDTFMPSSYGVNIRVPPVVTRLPIPSSWRFILLLPTGARRSGAAELAVFRKYTPLPPSEVKQTLAALFYGVTTSVAEKNLGALKEALIQMHRTGFKACELREQNQATRRLLARLYSISPNCAVGMSSMGPLIYAIVDRRDRREIESVLSIAASTNTKVIGIFSGRNRPYEVIN